MPSELKRQIWSTRSVLCVLSGAMRCSAVSIFSASFSCSDPAQFQNAHDQLMRSQKPGVGLRQLLDDRGELLTGGYDRYRAAAADENAWDVAVVRKAASWRTIGGYDGQ